MIVMISTMIASIGCAYFLSQFMHARDARWLQKNHSEWMAEEGLVIPDNIGWIALKNFALFLLVGLAHIAVVMVGT